MDASAAAAVPVRVRDVLPGWGVTQARVDEAVDRIVRACNPLRVVAFGSWARGEAGPDSDLDVAVFLDEASDVERGRRLYAAVEGRRMSIDILAFHVADHERLKRSRNSVHWHIAHDGRVLYERVELDPVIGEVTAAMEDDFAELGLPVRDRTFGFHAQQATEKLLKILIAANGATFQWTHDLESLLDHAAALGERVPFTKALAVELQPFGVLFRYGGWPQLPHSRTEIVHAVDALRSFVLRRVAELAPKP